MHINRLLLTALIATVTLAHAAFAEENLDNRSHLALAPSADSVGTPEAPLLTPSTQISTIAADKVIAKDKLIAAPERIPADLWQRIRNGFSMRELNSKLIARHEKWYASRPEYMARMSERSQRYLFYITEEVERRGMPSEIALLPMIESAFNPGANSVASASGIWQFMPSTGKNFGMQQNWWYDGRRDIISATNGALDYLERLHEQFGDWELALAAYNWGEGAVARAQARNRKIGKATNYASLRLPRETQNYVPKLLAIKNIVSDPDRFGLKLTDVPNQPYFAAVATSGRIDVKLAAELAGISLEEFIALNPGHNRPVILEETASVILLPIDKVEAFQTNLENTNQRLVSWQPYQTKKGDHFDRLAPRFGLSANQLRSINGLSTRAKISNGQTLLVPVNNEETVAAEFAVFNTHLASLEETTRTLKHTVRKGDTLSTIARRYHVSQARLLEWNNGVNKLKIGQRITIVQATSRGHKRHLARANKNRNSKNTKLVRNNKVPKRIISKGNLKIASSR
ncbi:MAG: membrane-bound lytic murein transglycosylase [Gallionellaceae bacterium]|nr:MAG: membrane-bound lytic murein transglycosylase [Gallionellaceae bacterium]